MSARRVSEATAMAEERAGAEQRWGLGKPNGLADHAFLAGTLPLLHKHLTAAALADRTWKAWGERPKLQGADRAFIRALALEAENDAEDTWDAFVDSTPGIIDDGRITVRKVPRKMLRKAHRIADKSVRRALRPLGNRGKRKTLRSLFARSAMSRRRRSGAGRSSSRGGARTRRRS